MTRAKQSQPDWPAVAMALAAQIDHTALHPAAMLRARTEFLRETKRGGKASRWAVGFSGGADSLALLLILWAEGPGRWGRDFVVLHFNHRLRGRESMADERFCGQVCRALGLTLVTGRWAQAKRGASEAEARAARLDFFHRTMARRKIRLLWLAQQQDDIAETMLMRLARGSGAAGLAAPRPVQTFGEDRLHLRPLLTLKKGALVAALKAAGAVWREDASNDTDAYFRNRLRRRVVPAWVKAAGRDAIAGAALSRERLEEDDEALEAWTDALVRFTAAGALDLRALAGRPRAVVRRALHRWLLRQRGAGELARQGFEALLTAVTLGRPTKHSLGREGFAVIRDGWLKFERQRAKRRNSRA